MEKQYQRNLTWNNNWIGDFESPWSIFEKFRYANAASVKDIFEIFGTPHSKNLKKGRGTYLKDLVSLTGFNDDLFNTYLGLYLKKVNQKNMNELTGVFLLDDGTDLKKYFNSNLVFCKSCISIGYHSIFHQFKLLNYCPFHKSELVNVCPNCNKHLPFLLSDRNTTFKCKCGYYFLSEKGTKEIFSLWKEVKKLSITDKKTRDWMYFNANHEVHSKFLFLYDLYLETDLDLISNFTSVLTKKPKILKQKKSSYAISYKSLKQLNKLDKENFKLRENVYKSTNQSLKSLIRFLKKTVLFKHKTCIARYKKTTTSLEEVCPYAYAFLNWRKNIEGLNNYWEVENGQRYKRMSELGYNYNFSLNQDYRYLFNLINKFREYDENYDGNHTELINIANRVICILALNHFNNWLRFAEGIKYSTHGGNTLPLKFESLPLFFIEFKRSPQKELLFWGFQSKIHQENGSTKILCPFDTLKKRRNPRYTKKHQFINLDSWYL